MKKLIYGSLFLALLGIGVVGCRKENNKSQVLEGNNIAYKSNVSSRNGILMFENWHDASAYMNLVVQKNEDHVNHFYDEYVGLSDEEMDSIQELLGWKYNQAYIDAENQFQYKSLLTFVDDKLYEENLTDNERIHWEKFLVEDDLGSILNYESIVIIGDSIYKFLQNMVVIAAPQNDLELIRQINDDNFEIYVDNKRLKFHGYISNKSACRANRQTYNHTWWNASGGSRTIRGWVIVRNIPSGTGGTTLRYVRAKTKAERFQNGKNRRWKTNISAATIGKIFRNNNPYNCQGTTEPCFTSRQSNAHTLTSTYKNQSVWQLLIFRARAGEVKSAHQAPGGYLEVILD